MEFGGGGLASPNLGVGNAKALGGDAFGPVDLLGLGDLDEVSALQTGVGRSCGLGTAGRKQQE